MANTGFLEVLWWWFLMLSDLGMVLALEVWQAKGLKGAFLSILYQICTMIYFQLLETLDIPYLFYLSLYISAMSTTLSTGTTFVLPSS